MTPQSVRPPAQVLAVPRRDEALEWIVQQLRWEVTLAELHTPTTVDEAA